MTRNFQDREHTRNTSCGDQVIKRTFVASTFSSCRFSLSFKHILDISHVSTFHDKSFQDEVRLILAAFAATASAGAFPANDRPIAKMEPKTETKTATATLKALTITVLAPPVTTTKTLSVTTNGPVTVSACPSLIKIDETPKPTGSI